MCYENEPYELLVQFKLRLHLANPHYVCLCVKKKNKQGRKSNKNREKVKREKTLCVMKNEP